MGSALDLDDLVSSYETARKELSALRKDAERYRYWRKNFASAGMGGVELIWNQPDACGALDGLVDYEMLQTKAHEFQMARQAGAMRLPSIVAVSKIPNCKWVTSIAYEVADMHAAFAFGSVLVFGKPPSEGMAGHEWACKAIRAEGVGLRDEADFNFLQLATTSMKVR